MTGEMTGRYLFLNNQLNLNTTCRTLRKAHKDFTFKVVLNDRIYVVRKDGKPVSEAMTAPFWATITRLKAQEA